MSLSVWYLYLSLSPHLSHSLSLSLSLSNTESIRMTWALNLSSKHMHVTILQLQENIFALFSEVEKKKNKSLLFSIFGGSIYFIQKIRFWSV